MNHSSQLLLQQKLPFCHPLMWKALKLDSALVAENVCPSTLCDGQTYHEPCPCLDSNQNRTWVLLMTFTCPGLTSDIIYTGDMFRLHSNSLTNDFVTSTTRWLKGDNENLDHSDLDVAVEKLIGSINGDQGFTITGWFKPATDDNGVAVENKKFHICSINPATTLKDTQLALPVQRYHNSLIYIKLASIQRSCGEVCGPSETSAVHHNLNWIKMIPMFVLNRNLSYRLRQYQQEKS